MKKLLTPFLISTFYFLIFTSTVSAAGLVPCTTDCTFCKLFELIERVLNFAIFNITIPLAVIFIVYGGFVILTAGDSPDKVSSGRKIITSAIIGVIIALLAWLFIDTILQVIASKTFGSEIKWWNPASKISC